MRLLLTCLLSLVNTVLSAGILRPVVEVEEDVYTYSPANNGAGPMWCHVPPSRTLEMLGEQQGRAGTISYARVRLY